LHDGREWKQFGNRKGLEDAHSSLNAAADNMGSGQLSPHKQIH